MIARTQIAAGCALLLLLAGCATSPGSSGRSRSSALLPAPRTGRPWLPRYDPGTDWNFTHASREAQHACLSSAALPIPRADAPTVAQASRLAACNSEALYYGFAGKPDYVHARECAYLERAAENPRPISGSAVLSMIYANGLGAQRSLPLAMKFACEAGGAPAEIDARVGHLEDLAAMTGQPRTPFDFCDDITSGYLQGVCTGIAARYRDVLRGKKIAQIASGYTPAQQAAFAALQHAAANFFDEHAANEVDLSGTARGAFWIEDIERSWSGFLRDLRVLEADELPMADVEAAHQADARLNAIYQRVLAEPSLRQRPPRKFPFPGIPVVRGTISRDGIRTDNGLWLSYRSAWLHFAAVRKPALPRSTVQAWITDQRTRNLRCLLPFRTPGARDCARPVSLTSNVRK